MGYYVIALHAVIALLFVLVVAVSIMKDKKRLAKNIVLEKDLKKVKHLKVISYFYILIVFSITILFGWITVDSVLDFFKKDYIYEERKLSSVSRKSYFHISYNMEFEGNKLDLSVFYKKDFEVKPGKKYGYHYGKRTKLIVSIKELE